MAGWWSSLLSLVRDPWEGVRAWRARREKLYEPSKPTFDAYPGLPDEPEMAEYIEARDALGRLLREYVDLKGYGVEHVNFDSTRWRRDFIEAHKSARKVLLARLRLAKIHKERRDKERAEEQFEAAMAREQKGQAIVEFAFMLPVLMSLILGMAGILFLDVSVRQMQNGIDVLAELASSDPGWRSKVASEDSRTKCNGGQPDVTYPDGNQDPGSRLLLTWTCHLDTGWLFDGTPISVQSEAVIR